MRVTRFSPFSLALAALLVGCANNHPPVTMQASAADMSTFSGRWEGEYSSAVTGRGGSIVFTLTAGIDSASGEVLMIPAGADRPIMREGPGRPPFTQTGATPELLTIRFVRAEQGRVTGELDPYRAPDCNCVVSTTFAGTLDGNRIAGTFTTRGTGRDVAVTGRWEVRRKR